MDGSEGSNTMELPDITIALASASDIAATQEYGKLYYYYQTSIIGSDVLLGTPTVTGLSAVVGLTSMGLITAILLASIAFLNPFCHKML